MHLSLLCTDTASQESPIVLQAPPKLKRQLSINTVEQTESLRVYKRPATLARASSSRTDHDDHDDVINNYVISRSEYSIDPEPRNQDFRQKYPNSLRGEDEVDGADAAGSCATSISGLTDRRRSSKENLIDDEISTSKVKYQRVPSIYCDKATDNIYENQPLPSPNRFNLDDIGLTSPFMARTSGGHGPQDDVFIFPESTRKVSPYKLSPSKSDRREHDDCEPYVRKRHVGESELYQREETYAHAPTERERPYQRRHEDRPRFSQREAVSCPEHVCPVKGFKFPKRPSVSDQPPFSPRVVSADTKPRFPSTVSTSGSRSQRSEYDDDISRLRLLQQEMSHAKNIYGSPPPSPEVDYRQMSPSRENGKIPMRSISDVARSPNEKDIRETMEDMQTKYMRSYSDPRSSHSQSRSVPQSPLVRAEKVGNSHTETDARVSPCYYLKIVEFPATINR